MGRLAFAYPRGLEESYRRELVAITSRARRRVEPKIESRLRSRLDAIGQHVDLDDLVASLFTPQDEQEVLALLNKTASTARALVQSDPSIRFQISGVPIAEDWEGDLVRLWKRENFDLIVTIGPTYLKDIEAQVSRAFDEGWGWGRLAKVIKQRAGVSDHIAERIARDQMGKLHGQLTQARQEAAGVKSYIWRTVQDERVRKEHVEREGVTIAWSDPPYDGHPGYPIQCRCHAEPIFEPLVLPAEPPSSNPPVSIPPVQGPPPIPTPTPLAPTVPPTVPPIVPPIVPRRTAPVALSVDQKWENYYAATTPEAKIAAWEEIVGPGSNVPAPFLATAPAPVPVPVVPVPVAPAPVPVPVVPVPGGESLGDLRRRVNAELIARCRRQSGLNIVPATLSPEEHDIVSAVTLFTHGNVKSVRDIGAFNAQYAGMPITGPVREIGGRFEASTGRDDYIRANQVLRHLESAEVDESTLFRGQTMSANVVRALVTGDTYPMGEIRSWSTSRNVATRFSGAGPGELNTVWIVTPLPGEKLRGVDVRLTSYFPDEEEIIMSGDVIVDSVTITGRTAVVECKQVPPTRIDSLTDAQRLEFVSSFETDLTAKQRQGEPPPEPRVFSQQASDLVDQVLGNKRSR